MPERHSCYINSCRMKFTRLGNLNRHIAIYHAHEINHNPLRRQCDHDFPVALLPMLQPVQSCFPLPTYYFPPPQSPTIGSYIDQPSESAHPAPGNSTFNNNATTGSTIPAEANTTGQDMQQYEPFDGTDDDAEDDTGLSTSDIASLVIILEDI